MNPRDAFKAGFLQACGEMGLTGAQVKDLTVKAAALLEKRAFGDELASGFANLAGGLALGVPTAAGALAGYGLHKLQGNQVDPDDVKKQELIQELRTYARRARESQKNRQLR